MAMARGGGRTAFRIGAAVALGLLLVLGGWALRAPRASADSAVDVYVRDLTPPVVSVDQNGSVTFFNQIADKTLSVGVGPLAVKAVVHTDVTLNLPSGSHTVAPSAQPGPNQPQPRPDQLARNQTWTEKFAQTCATCTISYAYRVEGAQLTQVLNQLPQLPPVPTPFVVNTILPLPNLPSVNVPQLPQININLPDVPGQLPANVPGGTSYPTNLPGQSTVTTTTTTTTLHGLDGPLAAYSLNGVDMAPSGSGAVRAFDPQQFQTGQQGSGSGLPVDQLGSPRLANDSAASPASDPFPFAALVALLSLAGVATWLARTYLAGVAPH